MNAWNEFADQLRHRDFERIWNAETRAVIGGGFHRRNNFWMRMTENRRSPSEHVIDVVIAIDIPDVRTAGAINEERLPAHRAKGAHRRIHAAGNVFQSLGKQRFRFGSVLHNSANANLRHGLRF